MAMANVGTGVVAATMVAAMVPKEVGKVVVEMEREAVETAVVEVGMETAGVARKVEERERGVVETAAVEAGTARVGVERAAAAAARATVVEAMVKAGKRQHCQAVRVAEDALVVEATEREAGETVVAEAGRASG